MRYKKAAVITAMSASFLLGLTLSEPIKDTRKYFHYEAAEGFYEKPYNLKIETRKNIEGKIETYLVDEETKQYRKIKPNTVKEPKQRINETLEKTIEVIGEIYEFFFD